MREMVPMTLEEMDASPFRFTATAELSCSPAQLFPFLAEPEQWPRWLPLMRSAGWTSTEMRCVGARRAVDLVGLGRFEESILACEPHARFAFTMIRTSSPMPARMAEDYRISLTAIGCRLDWTVAVVPTVFGRLVQPTLPLIFTGIWRGGVKQLRKCVA